MSETDLIQHVSFSGHLINWDFHFFPADDEAREIHYKISTDKRWKVSWKDFFFFRSGVRFSHWLSLLLHSLSLLPSTKNLPQTIPGHPWIFNFPRCGKKAKGAHRNKILPLSAFIFTLLLMSFSTSIKFLWLLFCGIRRNSISQQIFFMPFALLHHSLCSLYRGALINQMLGGLEKLGKHVENGSFPGKNIKNFAREKKPIRGLINQEGGSRIHMSLPASRKSVYGKREEKLNKGWRRNIFLSLHSSGGWLDSFFF